MARRIRKGVFSAELHGWHHFNPFTLSAEEFLGLSEDAVHERLERARAQFQRAGFPEPRVLSPPGWAVTDALLAVVRRQGLALAGSMHHGPPSARQNQGAGLERAHPLRPSRVDGVLNLPRNWDLRQGTLERALAILERGGVVAVHAHAADVGVDNGLTAENLANLARLLEGLERESLTPRFLHFRQLAGEDGERSARARPGA